MAKKTVKPTIKPTDKKVTPAKSPKTTPQPAANSPQKTAQKPKKKAVRPSAKEKAAILERRKLVWDLYAIARLPIRQISEHLKVKNIKGASPTQVHADIQFLLAENESSLKFSVEEYVEIECAVLDEIQATLYPKMKNSRVMKDTRAAADGIINCIETRAKLRGLNKPREIKLLTDEAFATLLGIEPEALPDDEQK